MNISVIIPVYNEEQKIVQTIQAVRKRGRERIGEILVVDADSTDRTVERAQSVGASVVDASQKGRAAQMNYGAQQSQYEILYFLHGDTLPPPGFAKKIIHALRKGIDAGCFQLDFDRNHWLLSFYGWCTQFDINAFRFGDQSLFVHRDVFFTINGFHEDHLVMEDNEIVRRIKKRHVFAILDDTVITSARSYQRVGIVKLQLVFVFIYLLYFLGVEQEYLVSLKHIFLE
ncbi:transferase 2, rSAM/selenodomain-associated [Fodinibius salinus]|uniref:Transferase 2, rSAM/selenodomain-associated n=1 Tax=Fodinibius salinus TaxID=860790 RepID=A0A5D3YJF3_9BACT|nr:TIGR04283 family arsenosugar biosynthesis glycosyltransferase [Fodinibius salinus]TYP93974.1 transferase 2, rSAM/selenodomain-associated [Fodinibius salinus]